MSVGQKVAGGVVLAMVATAVLLPGRQTVPVLQATSTLANGVIRTSEGQAA
jgi:hypothetical protein